MKEIREIFLDENREGREKHEAKEENGGQRLQGSKKNTNGDENRKMRKDASGG